MARSLAALDKQMMKHIHNAFNHQYSTDANRPKEERDQQAVYLDTSESLRKKGKLKVKRII